MNVGKFITAAGFMALLAGSATAATIGYSSPNFDDNFQTILREAAKSYAEGKGDKLLVEDAREDVGTQLSQVQNFIASGVDAIVVAPVSTESTPAITKLAKQAGIPLVYVNRRPADLNTFDGKVTYVGSDNYQAGKLEGEAACKAAGGKGDAVILIGFLRNEDAQNRTKAVKDVLATDGCKNIKVLAEQEGEWQRTKAQDIVANWLSAGMKPSIVLANNDEMALGAVQAMKSAGISMKDVVIAGIDATPDAIKSIEAGDMDITVFQNAKSQATNSIDAALKIIGGEKVDKYIDVPFVPVTKENLNKFK
ncbi:sugar ABC transporter substrate-binding protein [Labrys okinawensis]|uniref:sugar ABC transporter substrate-binding protein n=1 Tax=Labrys okinawensis TaxID=346911 RepID=UPI0039BCF053